MLSIGLPVVFAIGLFWYVYRNFSVSELQASISAANYWLLIGSLLPLAASHYLRSLRWRQLLAPLGYRPPISQMFAAVMSGYAANLILPRAGEVLRCTILQKTANVPTEISLGNVLAERVLDLVMLGLLTILALVVEYERLSAFLGSLLMTKLAGSAMTSGVVWSFVGGGFLIFAFTLTLLYALRNHHIVVLLWGFLTRLFNGLVSVKDVQNLPLFILYSILIWFGYYLSSAMVLYGFSPTADLPLASALVLNVIGAFGMVAPVQGGIGAYHYMVSTGLTAIYAVETKDSLGLAFLLHTSQMLFTLVLGGVCFLWLSQQTSKQITVSSTTKPTI